MDPDEPGRGCRIDEFRKSERRRPTPAPLADVRALLDRAEGEEGLALAVYLRIAAAAGGRRGEVHGLRWSGVEWAERRVRLVDNIVRAGRLGWIVKPTPQDDQPRLVALGQATMDLLARRRREVQALGLACGVALPARAFLFSNEPDGSKPWVPDTTWQRYRRLCRSLGMDPTRLHDLRVMMSTQLIEHGMPIPAVSARLGHAQNSTAAMTLDVYTGRNPDLDRQAAD